MTTRIQKSLRNLNRIMSDDYQKLSDRYQDLKLSHNRQEKLLKEADVLLRTFWNLVCSSEKYIMFKYYYCIGSFLRSAESLHSRIKRELNNPLYRCCERRKHG